jgi:hypothetical protein
VVVRVVVTVHPTLLGLLQQEAPAVAATEKIVILDHLIQVVVVVVIVKMAEPAVLVDQEL